MCKAILVTSVIFLAQKAMADGETEEECKAATCADFIRGDLDGDGDVDADDYLLWLTCVFNGTGCPPGGAQNDILDLNDDGLVDGSDSTFLSNFIVNGAPGPSKPYPDPGLDPTCDSLDGGCTVLTDSVVEQDDLAKIITVTSGGWTFIDPVNPSAGQYDATFDDESCTQGTMSGQVRQAFPLRTTPNCPPNGVSVKLLGDHKIHFNFVALVNLLTVPGAEDCPADCEQTIVEISLLIARTAGTPMLTVRNLRTGKIELIFPPWPGPVYGEAKVTWTLNESDCSKTVDTSQNAVAYTITFDGTWIQDRLCKQGWLSTDNVSIEGIDVAPHIIHDTLFPVPKIKVEDEFRFSCQNLLIDVELEKS